MGCCNQKQQKQKSLGGYSHLTADARVLLCCGDCCLHLLHWSHITCYNITEHFSKLAWIESKRGVNIMLLTGEEIRRHLRVCLTTFIYPFSFWIFLLSFDGIVIFCIQIPNIYTCVKRSYCTYPQSPTHRFLKNMILSFSYCLFLKGHKLYCMSSHHQLVTKITTGIKIISTKINLKMVDLDRQDHS